MNLTAIKAHILREGDIIAVLRQVSVTAKAPAKAIKVVQVAVVHLVLQMTL
jgi:hypothetical protein